MSPLLLIEGLLPTGILPDDLASQALNFRIADDPLA
jgi:hypothetical protein